MAATTSPSPGATAHDGEIRPFNVDVPEEELAGLRRRIAATRWPSEELVGDASQGVESATIRELARYWAIDHDWRKCEAKLNALPHFMTEIDGLGIHFIHVRSPHEDALPLIITHGWPGSVIELLEVVGPLTDPTAHWEHAPTPALVAKRLLESVVKHEVSPRYARFLNNATHWGFGLATGAGYGLLLGSRKPKVWFGLPFGAAVWASGYVVFPQLGVYEPIWKYDLETLRKDLSAHLVFGTATAAAFCLLATNATRKELQ